MLDLHDGELMPSHETCQKILRFTREWRADIVIALLPLDYQPARRYVGVLIQEAAFAVTVPLVCSDVPPLKINPSFFIQAMVSKSPILSRLIS